MASFFSSFRAVRALAVAFAALLLVGGVVSAPAPPVPSGDAGDLALVPADAQGLITLRIADLYKLDIVRKGIAALEKQPGTKTDFVAELRKATGLAPADVERLTTVLVDTKADVSYVIVSTTKPYDRARLLDKLGGAKTVKHGGRTYHVGKIATSDVAMYFVGPRVIVYAPESGMKACLGHLAARKNKGPLEDALKFAAGKRHFVAGLNPSSVALNAYKNELAKQWKGFNSLLDLKTATVALDFGTATQFELVARYPAAKQANDARKAAEGVKAAIELLALPTLVDALKQALPPAQAKDATDGIARALDSYKVEQKDTLVTVKFKIENKMFEALLSAGGVK